MWSLPSMKNKGVIVCLCRILDTDMENNSEWILYLTVSAFPKRNKPKNPLQVLLEKDNTWILASNIINCEIHQYLWNKNYT